MYIEKTYPGTETFKIIWQRKPAKVKQEHLDEL